MRALSHSKPYLFGSDSLFLPSPNIWPHWCDLPRRQLLEEYPHAWWHTIWQRVKHTHQVRKIMTQNKEDSSLFTCILVHMYTPLNMYGFIPPQTHQRTRAVRVRTPLDDGLHLHHTKTNRWRGSPHLSPTNMVDNITSTKSPSRVAANNASSLLPSHWLDILHMRQRTKYKMRSNITVHIDRITHRHHAACRKHNSPHMSHNTQNAQHTKRAIGNTHIITHENVQRFSHRKCVPHTFNKALNTCPTPPPYSSTKCRARNK